MSKESTQLTQVTKNRDALFLRTMFQGAQYTLTVYSHIILLENKYMEEETAVSIPWTMLP